MNLQKKAFTIVELLVSISIVAILSAVGFYSYIGYLGDSRDSERKANISEIKGAMKLYKQKRGIYPIPGNNFNITNSGTIVAIQGKLDQNVTLTTIDSIPRDPYSKSFFTYSVTQNKQEFEVSSTLENGEFPIALMVGDYKTVSKNVLPSINLASTGSGGTIEIHTGILDGSINRNYFILDKGNNLPYELDGNNLPYYAGESIDNVLSGGIVNFWQNSDFRDCSEIQNASKTISVGYTEEYQVLNPSGTLVNTGCLY